MPRLRSRQQRRALFIALGLAALGCAQKRSERAPPASAPCAESGCVETLYPRGERNEPRRGIQVDEKNVYWSEVMSDGAGNAALKVFMAPKDGRGVPRVLGVWDDYQAGESLVVDATHVFWLSAGKLVRARKDGTETAELTIPNALDIDPGPLRDAGDAVLVGSHACRYLARIPKDGSSPQRWPVSQRRVTGGSTGLEVDGPLYYCASGNHVNVLDTRTGEAKELVSYGGRAGALQRVDHDLYWVDADNPDSKTASLVVLAAGATAPVAVGPLHGGAGRLLFDGARSKLYWVTGPNNRACDAVAFDLTKRQSTFLARQLDRSGSTAQDDDHVYWSASQAIMRIRK